MTIQVGERIPSLEIQTMGAKGPQGISTEDIFAGKTVVLFGVPGAFTPGCSNTHLPGFVVKADDIKARGVDTIACVSVNDAFVMAAWGQAQNASEILMLADGNAELARALGLDLDARGFGMGVRNKRFAMIVRDGTVEHIAIDERQIEATSAEAILSLL